MRARAILWTSLGLNIALAGVLAYRTRSVAPAVPLVPLATNAADKSTPVVKTRVLVRKQFFSWGEIESKDYAAYIANLRDIDCPEATIRDIIVAEIDQIFARRRATEIPSTTRQWWRSEPEPALLGAIEEKLKALEEERITLLTKLLGSGWQTGLPEYQVAELDLSGPGLDDLTAEARQAVGKITKNAKEREENYLREREKTGEPADPKAIAQLQLETRKELARVLTPTQLEEYLLRYSSIAERLRRDLHGFEPTADEFRQIFRTLDPADAQVQLLYSADDAASLKKREELQAQTDATLKQVLGLDRFQLYSMTRDPAFNEAREMAQQYGASAEAVLPVYQVTQLAQNQLRLIENNPDLSDEDREIAIQQVQDEQQKSIQLILAAKGAARRALEAQAGMPPMPTP